jgi:hypothetical protein
MISPSQRPLPDNTQHTNRQTSILRRDSNPQSQQDSGSTPTPPTAHLWDRLIWLMTRSISSLLGKWQWTISSHKWRKVLLTICRNFSFSRKITFRGASLLFRSYFHLLIEMNYWEIEWKLSVGTGLALRVNERKHIRMPLLIYGILFNLSWGQMVNYSFFHFILIASGPSEWEAVLLFDNKYSYRQCYSAFYLQAGSQN